MDGVRQTIYHMCTHTYGGPNPWWRVDLGRVEDVAEVRILNRDAFQDRLNDAEIRVGQLNIMFCIIFSLGVAQKKTCKKETILASSFRLA